MLELSLKILASYLLGSVSGSLLLGRFKGVDIRQSGSGNAGGTNALRTQGVWFALGVIIIDIGKGALAAGPIAGFDGGWSSATLACSFAAVFGHCFPIWHGFRGGKGAATAIGALLVVHWPLVATMLVVWLLVVLLTGFVGLGTMLAAVSTVVYFFVTGHPVLPGAVWFFPGLAVFIIVMHHANVTRMLRGVENRTQRLWLFKPKTK